MNTDLSSNPTAKLRVVSMRSWIADELRHAADERNLEVVSDYGLDAPLGADLDAWWMPGMHAARLLHAGLSLTLTSPPADFLSKLPKEFLGRNVKTSRLKDASFAGSGWAKAADVKVEALPAKHYTDLSHFLRDAHGILAPDSIVQVSDAHLELEVEYRFYVLDGQVVAHSPYLKGELTFYDGLKDDGTGLRMLPFVRDVISAAKEARVLCSSFTLDVGLTPQGFRVIEANPSWCSGFYGADPLGVVDSLLQAAKPEADFRWMPDPYYVRRAEQMALLKSSSSPTTPNASPKI